MKVKKELLYGIFALAVIALLIIILINQYRSPLQCVKKEEFNDISNADKIAIFSEQDLQRLHGSTGWTDLNLGENIDFTFNGSMYKSDIVHITNQWNRDDIHRLISLSPGSAIYVLNSKTGLWSKATISKNGSYVNIYLIDPITTRLNSSLNKPEHVGTFLRKGAKRHNIGIRFKSLP